MNGRTQAYLDLAAMAPVGALLLDPRPAFVFRGDGSAVLWANAAGVAFFGEADMAALLDRRFSRSSRFATELARLAKSLPPDRDRLELLRIGFGATQVALLAACRRLDVGASTRAVLVAGAAPVTLESASTRAERLADAIAGSDGLAAVLDGSGAVLGASGGFDVLEPAAAALDALILEARRGGAQVRRRAVGIGGVARDAAIAQVPSREGRLFLLVVGPERPAEAKVAPQPAPADPMPREVDAAGAALAARRSAPDAAEAEPAREMRTELRFLWRTDASGDFVFVSPELGAAVGPGNAPRPDERWRTLAGRLAFEDADRMSAALGSLATFRDVTIRWPVAGTTEAVAVRLSGMPEFARDRTFRGYRGFGTIDVSDRRRVATTAGDVASAQEPLSADLPGAGVGPSDHVPASPAAGPGDGVRGDGADAGLAPAPEARPAEATPEDRTGAGAAVAPGPPPAETRTDDTAPDAAPSSNVVRIAASPARILPPRRLSGLEEDAFRRIAEALGARIADQAPPEDVAVPQVPLPEPPAPRAPDTSVLDRLPVGMVVYRGDRILYANRALLDLLGYDDLDGLSSAGGPAAVFDDGALEPAAGNGRVAVVRRDGSRVAVEARLHAVPWGDATAMMLSLFRPADEPAPAAASEDRAEELAGRVRELETILDTATDGVLIIEADGIIAGINRTAQALFGVEAHQAVGAPFTDLLAEESRRAALDYIDGLASNGVASVLNDGREVIGKVPRGGLIPLFMTIGALGDSGKYCAVLRDITHWKNVEEELVAARRAAETANAQKSEFLARISHEIRTPLNAIIGFSEVMMEERFGPIGSDRYRSYLRDIHLSGEHLMSLINDLLDLSKVEAGKLDLNFEAVSVNEVIRECVALMQPQANRDRIIIRTSLSTTLPNVVADLRSLRQIVLNVLSNAVKFTRSGGQVIVATALEENGEVVVRIRDTGIGMSAADLDTAMKPFRQVATSARPREGTGLGLPLTKALVEANRASFAIDSVPNQGTLVRIAFPTTRVLAG